MAPLVHEGSLPSPLGSTSVLSLADPGTSEGWRVPYRLQRSLGAPSRWFRPSRRFCLPHKSNSDPGTSTHSRSVSTTNNYGKRQLIQFGERLRHDRPSRRTPPFPQLSPADKRVHDPPQVRFPSLYVRGVHTLRGFSLEREVRSPEGETVVPT